MRRDEFEHFCEVMMKREADLRKVKNQEYTRGDEDALRNFKQLADFAGMRPSEVALVYLLKHIGSVTLAVKSGASKDLSWESDENGEGLGQRFADARNYMLLLAACLDDERARDDTRPVPPEQWTYRVYTFEGDKPEVGSPVFLAWNGSVTVDQSAGACIGVRTNDDYAVALGNGEICVQSVEMRTRW